MDVTNAIKLVVNQDTGEITLHQEQGRKDYCGIKPGLGAAHDVIHKAVLDYLRDTIALIEDEEDK